MAGTFLAISAAKTLRAPSNARLMGSYAKTLIGSREIVGYGFNGEPTYVDRPDFPLPAIRWKEPNSDIAVSILKCVFKSG